MHSFLLLICVSAAWATPNIQESFADNGIHPDVIDGSPQELLKIHYDGAQVNLGNELHPKDVKQIPQVAYAADPKDFYTVLMTDPDAPSRKNPTAREFIHWLVVNIPGNKLEDGEILSEYVGSGPPKNSGLHRYVTLLYKQPGKLDFSGETRHSKTDGNRKGFSARKFAETYKLDAPVAGNFFQAQWDDSVPKLHKQLGF